MEKILAYHGSGTKIDRFEFVFTNKGVDQLGSGFYFTTSMEEAISYTSARSSVLPGNPKPGGEDSPTVHVVELFINNPLDSTSTQGISASQALAIIKKSPRLEDCLWNWEDLSSVNIDNAARRAAKAYETQDGDTKLICRLNSLANDFFPEAEDIEMFNQAVQEVLGYDGVVCKEFFGKTHWVAWFPDQIRIIDWIAIDGSLNKKLIEAARQGNAKEVERLLSAGADVHASNDCALRGAAENGHVQAVERLLAAGADVHADDNHALRGAAENGHVQVVERLLAAGADVHADNDWALCWAALNGHTQVIEQLLAAGADVHASNDCALQWAADRGHVQAVEQLLAAGADVHANNNCALQWAAGSSHAQVVERLLAAGADVHADNGYALRRAALNGRAQVVKQLLAAGADVHADNNCALRWAAGSGHAQVVEKLLAAGAPEDHPCLAEAAKTHPSIQALLEARALQQAAEANEAQDIVRVIPRKKPCKA